MSLSKRQIKKQINKIRKVYRKKTILKLYNDCAYGAIYDDFLPDCLKNIVYSYIPPYEGYFEEYDDHPIFQKAECVSQIIHTKRDNFISIMEFKKNNWYKLNCKLYEGITCDRKKASQLILTFSGLHRIYPKFFINKKKRILNFLEINCAITKT
jgi:hypothetical protein